MSEGGGRAITSWGVGVEGTGQQVRSGQRNIMLEFLSFSLHCYMYLRLDGLFFFMQFFLS